MGLCVSWKADTVPFIMMQKLSSTQRFQTFGGTAEALCFILVAALRQEAGQEALSLSSDMGTE